MNRRKFDKCEVRLSNTRTVYARRVESKTQETYDIAVPDHKHVGFYLRWVYGLTKEEAHALVEALQKVLSACF